MSIRVRLFQSPPRRESPLHNDARILVQINHRDPLLAMGIEALLGRHPDLMLLAPDSGATSEVQICDFKTGLALAKDLRRADEASKILNPARKSSGVFSGGVLGVSSGDFRNDLESPSVRRLRARAASQSRGPELR